MHNRSIHANKSRPYSLSPRSIKLISQRDRVREPIKKSISHPCDSFGMGCVKDAYFIFGDLMLAVVSHIKYISLSAFKQ
jgi:hypothetical protein